MKTAIGETSLGQTLIRWAVGVVRREDSKMVKTMVGLAALMMVLAGSASAQNFVYTNDDIAGPNTVSGLVVVANGILTLVSGSPFLTGGTGIATGGFAPNRARVSAAGNFVFASNTGSNDVSVFAVDRSTGNLILVPGSPFPTGGSGDQTGIALAPTPNGMFLMAANSGSNNITVYSIANSGALTPVPGSPFPVLSLPDGIRMSPNGNFLAVAEPLLNQIEMLSIASNGSLASLGEFPGGGGNQLAGIDINCANSLLYGGEGNIVATIVDGYTIASSGHLTPVTGSPFENRLGVNSNVVLLGAKPFTKPLERDKLLFVSNQLSNTIEVFNVASTGKLALLDGSPFPISDTLGPSGMDTSPDGSLLYVSNFKNMVNVFSVGKTGALTEVAGSPFPTGQSGGLLSLTSFPPRTCQ